LPSLGVWGPGAWRLLRASWWPPKPWLRRTRSCSAVRAFRLPRVPTAGARLPCSPCHPPNGLSTERVGLGRCRGRVPVPAVPDPPGEPRVCASARSAAGAGWAPGWGQSLGAVSVGDSVGARCPRRTVPITGLWSRSAFP